MNIFVNLLVFAVAFLCFPTVAGGMGGLVGLNAAQAAEEAHGGGEGGKEGAPAGPIFVKMDPVVVPLVKDDGVSQIVSLLVTFEVKSTDAANKVENLRPRIRDAMIVNLYGMLTEREAMDKGVLRTDYLKKRLMESVEKVVGPDVLNDVLLQMVQQNPL